MITIPVNIDLADGSLTVDTLTCWQANPLQLDFTLPAAQTFNGLTALTVELRTPGVLGATGKLAQIVTANPTGTTASFTLTGPQMNQTIAAGVTEKRFDLFVYGESASIPHRTLRKWEVTMKADETTSSLTDPPPDIAETNLTETRAAELYQPLGEGAAVWGGITGTLANQTDLNDFHTNLLSNQDFMQGQIDALNGDAATFAVKGNNLSDLASASAALANLGGAAKSANLSDLASTATARTNLGCNDAGNITTGNLAVARIATALTTPPAIGGTTPGTIAGTTGTFTGSLNAAGGVLDLYGSATNEFRIAQTALIASGYISIKFTNPKIGLFRSGADHFIYYDVTNGNTVMDAVFGGAKLIFSCQGTQRAQLSSAGGFSVGSTTDAGVGNIYVNGCYKTNRTDTAAGTTGAQTINKGAGTVNFAAAATSLVVTNSLVTATTKIIATLQTNDTTAKSVSVVAASGSFTLYLNAAATAETAVSWQISG